MDAATPAAADGQLVRAIGTWGLAASIVNITIGGGIFRVPGSPDVSGALGAAAPLAYLACAALMGLIVVCIAQAGRRVSLTGGPYAYVEHTFGRYAGFLVGVMLWLIGATAVPAVATIFADAAGHMMPALNGPAGRAAFLFAMLGIVTYVNILGVKQGTRVNMVFTAGKLIPLLLLLVAGMLAVKGSNFRVVQGTIGAQPFARACVVLIFIFAGVETALVPSGEVKDPAHTVPRAVFLAMCAVTLIYIGLQVVAQGVLGSTLAGNATPLASAAERVFGGWGGTMIATGLLVSAFGYLSGMLLATPRALYAFARDGILPRQLAAVHARYRTPWIAIIAQALIAWILAVTSRFETLLIIANVSAALIYLGCAAAAWKLQRSSPSALGTAVPLLAALGILALLSSVTLKEWTVLASVLVVATVLYLPTMRARTGMT